MNIHKIPRRSFFIVLTLILTIKADEDTGEPSECGQYGFKCMDEKTLEFCPTIVDGVADIAQIYECDEHFTCDEDNPAYCTPKEAPNKLLQDANKETQKGNGGAGIVNLGRDSYDEMYFSDDSYYRQVRAANAVAKASHDDDCVCETTAEAEEEDPVTTVTESIEESDFTTINITPSSPFDCDSYGFFADPKNSSLFWHCDVPLNGKGFLLRHMKCGRDRLFDEMLKSCVLEGTIRQERKFNTENGAVEIAKRKLKYTTDCKNQKPGKYADALDCHVYHLCLPKQFSPATQLSFVCPRQTAYDSISRSCTIAAFERCDVKAQPSNNINCTTPMRFRSIDDCKTYFICFVDNVIEIKCPKFYKYDDNAMECLPEKIANCREYFT